MRFMSSSVSGGAIGLSLSFIWSPVIHEYGQNEADAGAAEPAQAEPFSGEAEFGGQHGMLTYGTFMCACSLPEARLQQPCR